MPSLLCRRDTFAVPPTVSSLTVPEKPEANDRSYRFSVGQLPAWAKKQVQDGHKVFLMYNYVCKVSVLHCFCFALFLIYKVGYCYDHEWRLVINQQRVNENKATIVGRDM